MKHMKHWLMTVAVLLCSVSMSAYDFEEDGIYYSITSAKEKTVSVTYRGSSPTSVFDEYKGKVSIPSIVQGYSVTSIGQGAFERCSITSIDIPETVTSIKFNAFFGCSSLTSITIPQNSQLTNIGNKAFYNCYNLASISIPESVTSIGDETFYGCTKLADIDISQNSMLASLGRNAFAETAWSANLPNGIKYIGKVLYKYVGTMPENTNIEIREGIIGVCDNAFFGCSNLASIIIPASVVSIGLGAFEGCSNLTSITCKAVNPPTYGLHWVVKSIPVYVPASSVEAYKSADGWKEFTNIQPILIASGTCGTNLTWKLIEEGELIIEGVGAMPNYVYSSDIPWYPYRESVTKVVIRNGVTSIGNLAFYGTNVVSVSVGESVTSIGDDVFYMCKHLTSITIPEGVTKIGNEAFQDCTGLASVTLPSSLKSIDYSAFYGCESLASITMLEGVTSIGDDVFRKCTSLSSITIPASVTSIGRSVFYGCTNLKTVCCKASNVPATNLSFDESFPIITLYVPAASLSLYKTKWGTYFTNIKAYDLSGVCGDNLTWKLTDEGELIIEGTGAMTEVSWSQYKDDIKTVTIKDGVTTICGSAFYECTNLANITIPNSVKSIGREAFSGCSSLKSIVLPSGLTSIANLVFENCSQLTSIEIPNGVTRIGDGAFWECTSLKSVVIPNSVVELSVQAFYGCSALENITIPNSITSVGAAAFYRTAWLDNQDGLVYVGKVLYKYKGATDYNIKTDRTVDIADGIVSVADNAFQNCAYLEDVTFPESLTSMGGSILLSCTWLKSITCNAVIPPTVQSGTFWGINNIFTIKVNVPASSVETYKAADGWKEFTNIQPIESFIASGTCGDNLTWKLTEEGELIIEGKGAMLNYSSSNKAPWYEYRESINKISIAEGVTSIGDYVFRNCSCLTSIVIPEGVTSIGYQALFGCKNVASITIPESVTSIGIQAFSGCSITSIIIPRNVTSINHAVFSGCSNLTAISVAEGNANYDSRGGCNAIIETNSNTLIAGCSSTIIPENVTTIGQNAFFACKSLASITIPESVTSLKRGAFNNCTSLATITIPENVKSIDAQAFDACSNLTSVILLSTSLNSIGFEAFRNCSSFTSITCSSVVPPSVGNDAFLNVDKSIPVYVPASSVNAYKAADGWKEFTNIQPILSKKEILDNTESFSQAEDEDFDVITYKRSLSKVNTWYALYLPFEIPVTEGFAQNYEVGYFNDIHSYDEYIGEKENGVKGSDGEIDRMSMEVLTVQQGATLNANYPYLIRAKNQEALNMELTVEDATLYRTVETKVSCSSVFMKFDVTGIYTATAVGDLRGDSEYDVYAVSGGSWNTGSKDSDKVRAFRLYLKLTSIDGSPVKVSKSAMKAISIRVDGEEGTTTIDNAELTIGNVEDVVYDLQGRRVANPGKGMYIVNGKKVIFK